MDNQQLSINSEIYYRKPASGNGFIYKYTSPSGKSYIGKAIGTLKKRAINLVSGIGYKKCPLFWRAINKYGFLNFQVEIIEEAPLSILGEKEIFYIEKYNTRNPHGYNIAQGGEGGQKKEVYVYSAQNGEYVGHYSSLTEASVETGVPIETISIIMKQQRRKQAHNLIFLDSYIERYDINNLARKNYTKVFVYDKNGSYVGSYSSISNASKELGISESAITRALAGTILHASFFQFRKEKEEYLPPIPKNSKSPIPVCQIDPKTGEILNRFSSLQEAGRAVGLTSGSGIKKVITRGKGTSGGYFWIIDESSTTK